METKNIIKKYGKVWNLNCKENDKIIEKNYLYLEKEGQIGNKQNNWISVKEEKNHYVWAVNVSAESFAMEFIKCFSCFQYWS